MQQPELTISSFHRGRRVLSAAALAFACVVVVFVCLAPLKRSGPDLTCLACKAVASDI